MDTGIEKRKNGRAASKNETMKGKLPKTWNNGPLFDKENRNNGREVKN